MIKCLQRSGTLKTGAVIRISSPTPLSTSVFGMCLPGIIAAVRQLITSYSSTALKQTHDRRIRGNSLDNKGRPRPGQQRLGFSSGRLGYINDYSLNMRPSVCLRSDSRPSTRAHLHSGYAICPWSKIPTEGPRVELQTAN